MTPDVATQAAADPLAELRGLHLPEAVGAWPPAPGWWIAAAILVCAVAAATWLARRRRRSLGARALRELRSIERRGTHDVPALATDLAELLRRVALERFGAVRVASLSGETWGRFLAESAPRSRKRRGFDAATGRALALAPYAPRSAAEAALADVDRARLVAATRDWIRGNT
jgi:hypothetical protein